ncbi:MAG: hypothetical protein AM325_004585 [Candidatus Thorarchaeota archaeon SMTZ1-45]|nr:MAG: hypothetical protein AM325_06340 [Candidatus Thorarchaeota archaeon SMTZ1-45]
MPAPKELERLGNLFTLASERNRPFLDRCSETKYLAVRNYDKATTITVELTKQTLKEANSGLTSLEDYERFHTKLRSVVESGQLDNEFIRILEKLRSKYLEKVLRPAIHTYLRNEDLKPIAIEALYNDALRIEGLLEVVQFLKKVESVV